MEFTQHFAWAVDSSVASDSRAKGNVAVGLDAAAQAFGLLPVAEADRWNLKEMAEMDDSEKAWPHVKKVPGSRTGGHWSPVPCLHGPPSPTRHTSLGFTPGTAHARLSAPGLRRRDGQGRVQWRAGDAILEKGRRAGKAARQGASCLRSDVPVDRIWSARVRIVAGDCVNYF